MRYPFTNEGFVALQEQLQQLDNQALSQEASLISADFSKWLISNFELDSSQQLFLKQIAPSALALYGAETAFAVANRLMVKLDKDDKDKDEQGKIIWNKSSLSAKAGLGGQEPSGELIFYIRYTEG